MSEKLTEFERMKAGRLYNADDAELGKIHIRAMTLCQKFNAIPFDHQEEKQKTKESNP